MLSSQVVFQLDKQSFTVPGYMVWCALLYAAAGSWLTWLVGRPLIRLNDNSDDGGSLMQWLLLVLVALATAVIAYFFLPMPK